MRNRSIVTFLPNVSQKKRFLWVSPLFFSPYLFEQEVCHSFLGEVARTMYQAAQLLSLAESGILVGS